MRIRPSKLSTTFLRLISLSSTSKPQVIKASSAPAISSLSLPAPDVIFRYRLMQQPRLISLRKAFPAYGVLNSSCSSVSILKAIGYRLPSPVLIRSPVSGGSAEAVIRNKYNAERHLPASRSFLARATADS